MTGIDLDHPPRPASPVRVLTVQPGANVTVDSTDPWNPIVSASGGGGGGIESVVGGLSVTVDNTDPANPVVGLGGEVQPYINVSTDPVAVIALLAGDNSRIEIDDANGITITSSTKPLAIDTPFPLAIPRGDVSAFDPSDYQGSIFFDAPNNRVVFSNYTDWVPLGGGVQSVEATNGSVTVNNTDPANPTVSVNGFIFTPVAHIGALDPTAYDTFTILYDYTTGTAWVSDGVTFHPFVTGVVGGTGVTVDNTNPAAPIVNVP